MIGVNKIKIRFVRQEADYTIKHDKKWLAKEKEHFDVFELMNRWRVEHN
jgi:hypothetical protein